MGNIVLGVDNKRIEALKKLYEQPLKAAKKQTEEIKKTTDAINSSTNKAASASVDGVRQNKLGAAVEKGTVDAYRAELAGRNSQVEYAKQTSKNSEKLCMVQKQSLGYLKNLANIGVA